MQKDFIALKISGSLSRIKKFRREINSIGHKRIERFFHHKDLEFSFDRQTLRESLPDRKKVSKAVEIMDLLEDAKKGGQLIQMA